MRNLFLFLAVFFATYSTLAAGDPLVDLVLRTASRQKETPAAIRIRASTIKQALRSLPDRSSQAVVAVIWQRESAFALDVHAGERGRHGSDNGKAKCMGQVHANRFVPKHEWERLGGTDLESTTRCARATLLLIKSKMRYCSRAVRWDRQTLSIALQAYATGRCEAPSKESLTRQKLWVQLRATL